MIDANSPRGLVHSIIQQKWPEVCEVLLPNIVAVDLDQPSEEVAVGHTDIDDGALAWAAKYTPDAEFKEILIELSIGDHSIVSHHMVPVSSQTNSPFGEIDPERKHLLTNEYNTSKFMETIHGISVFLRMFDTLIAADEYDITDNVSKFATVESIV